MLCAYMGHIHNLSCEYMASGCFFMNYFISMYYLTLEPICYNNLSDQFNQKISSTVMMIRLGNLLSIAETPEPHI